MAEIVIGILLIVGAAVWLFTGSVPAPLTVQFWQLVTYSGVAYLAIGLVRDVLIRFLVKRPEKLRRADYPTLCLESFVAPLVVLAGLGILLAGVRHAFQPTLPALGLALGALFILSGLLKDIVIKFAREKHHTSYIPW